MEKLRYYLEWWFEYQLPEFIPRKFSQKIFKTKLIPVLVGIRRSGKSTLFFQLISDLRKSISSRNILYINFEDDRLLPLEGTELANLLLVYRQNYRPALHSDIYLFLDEIQNLPNWEAAVRRIYETEKNVRLFLTGSNSKMLSKEISTTLRGRTLPFKVFPLNFSEFLDFRHVEPPEPSRLVYSPKFHDILFEFDQYLTFGGFPAVVLEKDAELKEEILKQYLDTIFFRDIVERFNVRNYRALEIFIRIIARQIGSLISYGKLVNALKSIGVSISKNTVIDYFSYIESAMLGFGLPIYSYSIKDQLQYPKKFYLADNGLFRCVTFLKEKDHGHLLENLVFNHLQKNYNNLFYWKGKNGYEVDFVIPKLMEKESDYPLVQVCYQWNDSVKKRKIRALLKAAQEFNVKSALIITRDQKESVKLNGLTIEVKPFVEWSLENYQ